MSSAIGNSGKSTNSNGVFVDVRDFGAKAEVGFDNSPAFQAAVDYVSSIEGGGTVYIPASSLANPYYLEKPVFINGHNVKIQGEGKRATFLKTWGSAFIVGRHPRYWESRKSTYVDSDTGATVNIRNTNNEVILDTRYRTDLFRFKAQGDLGSGPSGVPPLNFPFDTAGQYFGLRTRGVVKGTFRGSSLATGNTNSGNIVSGWENQSQVTFNFIYYAHNAKVFGGIAGCGEVANPDPWLLMGEGNDFIFSLSLTNDTLIDKGLVWLRFAQPATLGLHRVSVQVDFVNKRFSIFVDNVQVAFSMQTMQPLGFQSMSQADVFTKFDKINRWESSDFAIGSTSRSAGKLDANDGNVTDFTIVGVAAYPGAHFVHGSAGQAQARVDGQPINDSNLAMPYYPTVTGAIGCLFNKEATGADLKCIDRGGGFCYGMITPDGNGGNGGPSAISNPIISDLCIQGYDTFGCGEGITLGVYLHCEINDVAIRSTFYSSIGCLDLYVCYALYINDCELQSPGAGMFLVNQSWVIARNIKFGYVGRAAVRASGSSLQLYGGMTNDFEGYAEGFLIAYCGKSIGAGYRLEDIMVNLEGVRYSPRVAHIYIQKSIFHGGNKLILKNMILGSTSTIPSIYLDDPLLLDWTNYPGDVRIEDCGLPSDGPVLKIRGKDWRGTIDVARNSCFDDVVEVVPSMYDYINTKTVHRDFYSTPNLGGWTKDNHQIFIRTPQEGGVSVWGCSAAGREGTATPPSWIPLEFRTTRRKHVLSGNIRSTMYMTASAFLPNVANPMTMAMTVVSDMTAKAILRFLLNRTGTVDRDKIVFRYGVMTPFSFTDTMYGTTSQSSLLNNDANFWNVAANGLKTNKTAINLSAAFTPELVAVITRRAGFTCEIGNSNTASVFVGKTERVTRDFFTNASLSIPANGIQVANAIRDGSWSRYIQNRIADWLFGYPSQTFPSTFHVGLSKTPIAVDGTGITEISGGNYARVAVPLNTTNFRELGEYGTTWCNAIDIQFNNATADWGDCEWFFIADAANGGNVLASGPLNRPVSVKSGDTGPVFLRENLHFQI
ncbi:hypothetical protein GC170_17845 [bacterium]|nr:hypothetical protein [bacterium]